MRLHSSWILKEEFPPEGNLFIWAESLWPYSTRRKKKDTHPYAISPEELLRSLGISGRSYQARLVLPSHASSPIHSSLLNIEKGKEYCLKGWKTPGIVLEVGDILDFLVALDEGVMKEERVLLGDDVKFLSRLARFALCLLRKQRFLPYLTRTTDDNLVFFWKPVFISDEERKVFSQLRISMPDAVRAASPTRRPPSREKIIEHFLAFLMNYAIEKLQVYSLREFFTGKNHLNRTGNIIDIPQKDLLYDQFNEWASQLEWKAESGGFRICLRLEEPKTRRRSWLLRFLLQSTDDPSLMIDARDAWSSEDLSEEDLNQLLKDLVIAARFFPIIERALDSSTPYSIRMNTNQAYSFLREAAPMLAECGFGIFVPSFWRMKKGIGRRPSVVLKVVSAGKGGEFGLSKLVDFDWRIAVGDKSISKAEFERLVRLKIPLVNIRGEWVELQPGMAEDILEYLRKKKEITLSDLLKVSLGGDDDLPVASVDASGWVGELLDSLKGKIDYQEIPQPEDFNGQLRPYQVRGFSWMAYMNRFGFGVCLADDMGLGKTIQFIALLLHQKKKGLKRPSLLVVPTSVIGNWEREINRFAPRLRVLLHHGPSRLKGKRFKKTIKTVDAVITGYPLIYRDRELFGDVKFSYIVLDEAQKIKNPYTKQAQSIRQFNCDLKIALTGTPIENRLTELWSIMEFLNPGYLGGLRSFKRNYAIPIERYNDREKANRLKAIISPFILRRLKTDPKIISDLPNKVEIKTFCPLVKEQATLYQVTVDEMMESIGSSKGMKRKGAILALLMKLKQICNHPALFLHDKSKIAGRSGKLLRLKEMLEEVLEEGDRALIFTQFAEMGRMLKTYLEDVFLQEVLFLYGGVPRKIRERLIARFQSKEGPPFFILSLKAGGLGLNLTSASRVFHFDRWWNPAVEDQATDRCFRIGQRKDVIVHKFICQGTLEERIDALLEKKRGLADRIIGAGESWLTELSTSELSRLLTLSEDAVMG